jgi:hypothetical protein
MKFKYVLLRERLWPKKINGRHIYGSGSGTLVADRLVLTAAHVITNYAEFPEQIAKSDLHFQSADKKKPPVKVKRIVAIGNYLKQIAAGETAASLFEDWALLELTESLNGVEPIKLASRSTKYLNTNHSSGLLSIGFPGSAVNILFFDNLALMTSLRFLTIANCGLDSDIANELIAGGWYFSKHLYITNCQVSGGNSGGPLLAKSTTGDWVVLGLTTNLGRTPLREMTFGLLGSQFSVAIPTTVIEHSISNNLRYVKFKDLIFAR